MRGNGAEVQCVVQYEAQCGLVCVLKSLEKRLTNVNIL